MKRVFPLHDNLVIERDKANEERVTPGGIHIPVEAVKAQNIAKVLSVGPDVQGIADGDVVVIGDFVGTKVVVNDEEFSVVSYKDVLGVYK